MTLKSISTLCLGTLILAGLTGCDDRTAEQKGAAMANEKIDMAKGIGTAMEAKGGQASEAVATGIGTVFKGIEKGIEKSGTKLVVDESLTKAGLTVTTVQNAIADQKHKAHGMEMYVASELEARGKLRVLAYDSLDREIARVSVDLVRAADEAKYLRVPMEPQLSLASISKVALSFKPAEQAAKK